MEPADQRKEKYMEFPTSITRFIMDTQKCEYWQVCKMAVNKNDFEEAPLYIFGGPEA